MADSASESSDFKVPDPIVTTLHWLNYALANDREVARVAKSVKFDRSLQQVRDAIERRNLSNAEVALEQAVEEFAWIQAKAFLIRRQAIAG